VLKFHEEAKTYHHFCLYIQAILEKPQLFYCAPRVIFIYQFFLKVHKANQPPIIECWNQ